MRVKNMPALALIVAAAGLSLTACGSSTGSSASARTSPSIAVSSSVGGQGSASASPSSGSSTSSAGSVSASPSSGSSTGTSTGSGLAAHAPSSTSMCKTDKLGFSVAASGTKNEIVVNLKNNGSSTCSLHGFPGVQLIGPNGLGDTGPDAARTDVSGSTISLGPGEETRFLLDYMPATSGSTKTYTRLSVTPPNQTVGEIVNLNTLAITIATPSAQSPDVFVYPIGYHTGSGK